MRDSESVNFEELEEADLLIERLPRGDPAAPEFARPCTELLKHVIEAKRDLMVRRHRTAAARVERMAVRRLMANHGIDYLTSIQCCSSSRAPSATASVPVR